MSVRGAGGSSAPEASHRELFSQMTAPAPRYVLVSTAGDAGSQGQHAINPKREVTGQCVDHNIVLQAAAQGQALLNTPGMQN